MPRRIRAYTIYVIQIGLNRSILLVNYCLGNPDKKLHEFIQKQPHLRDSVLRIDLCHQYRQYKTGREALRACRELIRRLEATGFEVIAGTPLMLDRWSLYVIEITGRQTYLYVGSTNYPIQKRLEQHIYKYYPARIFLREDIFELDETRCQDLPTYRTKKEAEKAEAQLAQSLRLKGYKVKGGH